MLTLSFVAGALGVWAAQQSSGWESEGQPGATANRARDESTGAEPAGRPVPDSAADSTAGQARASPESVEAPAASAEPSPANLPARYRQWARTDPAAFLDALRALEMGDGELSFEPLLYALRLAAEADPGLTLETGERYGGEWGAVLRSLALEALAASEPDAAVGYLVDIEPGDLRDRLLASVAAGYARADLNAAVRWLGRLTEADGAAFYPVIAAVAAVDLGRAIELDLRAIELDYGGPDYGDSSWLRPGLLTSRASPARVADQLASIQFTGLLADTLGYWAIDDPYGAAAWIQTQETISSSVVSRMANQLASFDPGLALNLSTQFSPPVRAAWLEAVIGQTAMYDPLGALDTLEDYRQEPLYDTVYRRIIQELYLRVGPTEAARIVGNAPPVAVAGPIAGRWAQFDPAAAGDWVRSIEDETVRARAAQMLVLEWSRSDAAAAEVWVRGIADFELRSTLLDSPCIRMQPCPPGF